MRKCWRWVIGSDVTVFHCYLQRLGVISFHSPMPATGLFTDASEQSLRSFRTALFSNDLNAVCQGLELACIQPGKGGGRAR